MTSVRLTTSTLTVLGALLEHPTQETYGQKLIAATGKSPGVVYPLLARLEKHGWLSARWEDADLVEVCRPPRLYHRLTADGIAQARAALARQTRPNRR